MIKPTKDQIKEYYSAALERCLSAFASLDEKEWAKKASDHWTAKEHLALLAVTPEVESLPETKQALAGEPVRIPGLETREDVRAFRQNGVDSARDLSVSELITRMKSSVDEHIGILDGLSEADLDKPAQSPTWDRAGTVRDLFAAAYQFLARQYQEIRRVAKKKLPHWIEGGTPEQSNYFLDRTFHYMPLILWRDRADGMAVTYRFMMEGAGGGQWSISIADGRADSADGEPESFDAEIRTKPELWMDLTMGDLSPPIAIMTRKVKLGGNAGLAMKLSTLFGEEG
jgi:hypothetical protein